MSRFYAEILGSKGTASRIGNKVSGMTAHICGWNIGVKVRCYVNKDGKDVIEITQTGGSSNVPGLDRIIKIITEE